MQTKITFDKDYIQSNTLEGLKNNIINTKLYLPVVTCQLKLECIGDLEKKFKNNRNKKNHTTSLFLKLDLFASSKHNHMDFVRQELLEDIKINQKHDFFNYVTKNYLCFQGLTIDLYSDSGKDKQIQMWSNSNFEEPIDGGMSGREMAKFYRENARGLKGFISADLQNAANRSPVPLEDLICRVKSINFLEPYSIHTKAFLLWLREKREPLPNYSLQFIKAKASSRSLVEFAPYTAYVYTITLLHAYNLLHNEKFNKKTKQRDSDWMDLNYIFYFPFIDCFASKDKFFSSFLKNFKQFERISLLSN